MDESNRAGRYQINLPMKPTIRCMVSHFTIWEEHNRFNPLEKWCPVCQKLFFWRKKK